MEELDRAKRDFRKIVLIMAGFSFVVNLLLLAMPLYMLQIYDRVLPSRSVDTLIYISIFAVMALAVLGIMEALRSRIAVRAANRFDVDLGAPLLQQTIRYGINGKARNAQPLRDLAQIRQIVASRVVFNLLDLPFTVIFLGLLYLIHPNLFWLTVLGAVIAAGATWLNERFSKAENARQSSAAIASAERSEHFVRSGDSLLAMGMTGNAIDYWGEGHARMLQASDKASGVNAFFLGLTRFVRFVLQSAILGYGAVLVLSGEITAGMIFASSLIAGRALQPFDQIIASWRTLVSGQAAWKRLEEFVKAAGETHRDYTSLPRPKGALQVAEVVQQNLIDKGARPILGRVSFELEPGDCLAIIGPSGSGKSTLARILVGALKPHIGTVRLDGHDIFNWEPEERGRYVGYIAQEVELLPGTIAQNISRFNPDAGSEQIIEAARNAHAEDLIKAMPSGYDTLIGPGGMQLSGGERQRIGLARAFFGDPAFLVLDEPNASLDRNGEIALVRAMADARKRGVTMIVITQRESVLAICTKIMRIQNGSIVDFGPAEEVMQKFSAAREEKPTQPPAPQWTAPVPVTPPPVQPAAAARPPATGFGTPLGPITLPSAVPPPRSEAKPRAETQTKPKASVTASVRRHDTANTIPVPKSGSGKTGTGNSGSANGSAAKSNGSGKKNA